MKRIFYLLSLSAVLATPACKTAKPTSGTNEKPNITGSTNLPQSYYDNARQTVAPASGLAVATDPEYGVTQQKPICVGGKTDSGARNQQRYLNALRGPGGEEISYRRRGSCCAFKTPNGIIGGMGMLDVYEVSWAGSAKPMLLYLNFYDDGPLLAPVGLTLAQP
ncbi:hypothetical protein [Hymenobacter psychrotolerans]|uniref:2-dehydro-3-deoxyphosphooctonate aldolase n=1 Tax=Hymenobacter psychrotolerans DSM 18569 TaxID=1121959 RepID=A0A1M7F904_9BACT|nr:hypothetical protein [Hymenobacter psychrotolerans]SHM00531.1 hypothetical protein SAMN02746009_03786 [Hymenobacter psychrotolerans DSM 18569]